IGSFASIIPGVTRCSSRNATLAMPLGDLDATSIGRTGKDFQSYGNVLDWSNALAVDGEEADHRSRVLGVVQSPERVEWGVSPRSAQDAGRQVAEFRLDLGVGERISRVTLRIVRALGEPVTGAERHLDLGNQLVGKAPGELGMWGHADA